MASVMEAVARWLLFYMEASFNLHGKQYFENLSNKNMQEALQDVTFKRWPVCLFDPVACLAGARQPAASAPTLPLSRHCVSKQRTGLWIAVQPHTHSLQYSQTHTHSSTATHTHTPANMKHIVLWIAPPLLRLACPSCHPPDESSTLPRLSCCPAIFTIRLSCSLCAL